jgi:hypothetical protein
VIETVLVALIVTARVTDSTQSVPKLTVPPAATARSNADSEQAITRAVPAAAGT